MEGVTRIISGLFVVFIATSAILYTLPYETNPLDDISWLGFSNEEDKELLVATHTKITLWDTDNGTLLRSRDLGSTIREFDISIDNILTIGTKDGRIIFMDPETLEIFDTYFLSAGVSTIDWSINSSFFAAGLEDGTIIVWDDEFEVLNVSFAEEEVNGVSISPDGNTIAICYESFGLLVLNVSEPYTFLLQVSNEAKDCTFSPLGDLAVVYEAGQVVVYNIETQGAYSLGEIDEANNFIDWSSDGSRLFASGGTQTLKIWSIPDGTLIQDQTFKRSYVRHMVAGDAKVAVATYRYVYLYNLNGKSIFDFPSKPEAPLLLPISIIGAVALIILIIISELSRRRFLMDSDAVFIERKLPINEIVLLGLLGVFAANVFSFLLSVLLDIVDFAPWFVFIFSGMLGANFIIILLAKYRQVVIDSQGITLSTSIYQSIFKGKPKRISLGSVAKIHPYYFYNRLEKDIKHLGFDVILMDGQVGNIIFASTPMTRSLDDVKSALAKVFGTKWTRFYTDEPYIDTERWEKIKHLSKKTWASIIIEFMVVMHIPFIIMVLFILSMSITSFNGLMLFLIGMLSLFIIVMIYEMKKMMNFHQAVSIKANIEMLEHMRKAPLKPVFDESKEKSVLTPEKHLRMTEKEWRDIERLLAQERPTIFLVIVLMIGFFVSMMMGIFYNLFIMMFPAAISFGLLMFFVFYVMRFQQARTLVKKAVEHELKTGELVLPKEFNIPKVWYSYISREPIPITEKERAVAKHIIDQGELWVLKFTIAMIIILVSSTGIFFVFNPFNETWFKPIAFMAIMMGPIFILLLYVISKQKIIMKVKQSEEREKILKERKGENL